MSSIPLLPTNPETSDGFHIQNRYLRHCRPLAAAVSCLTGVGGVVVIYGLHEVKNSPFLRTICTTASGALFQLCAELTFSRSCLNPYRKIVMHYSSPAFLALWQLYLNLPDQTSRESILDLLCALGGCVITIKLNRIFYTTVEEAKDPTRVYKDDKGLTLAGYPTTSCGQTVWHLLPLISGILLVVLGNQANEDEILELLGYLLIGLPIGSVCASLWERLGHRLESNCQEIQRTDPTRLAPPSLRLARTVGSLSSAFAASFWGALIVPHNPLSMLGVGTVLGATHHYALNHFRKLDTTSLAPSPSSCNKWSFRLIDTSFCLGASGFIIWQMVEGTPVDQTSLGSFVLGGLGGFLLAQRLQKKYNPQSSSHRLNTVQLLTTEFTDWQPGLFFLVTKVQNISDRGLSGASLKDAILSSIAYLSLGFSMGTDQATTLLSRFEFSAITNVLFGRLLVERMSRSLQ